MLIYNLFVAYKNHLYIKALHYVYDETTLVMCIYCEAITQQLN